MLNYLEVEYIYLTLYSLPLEKKKTNLNLKPFLRLVGMTHLFFYYADSVTHVIICFKTHGQKNPAKDCLPVLRNVFVICGILEK